MSDDPYAKLARRSPDPGWRILQACREMCILMGRFELEQMETDLVCKASTGDRREWVKNRAAKFRELIAVLEQDTNPF